MLTLQKRLGRLMEREATPLIDAASISQEPLESSDEAPNSTVQASTIPEVVVTLAEHN
jgi:hypothetical protein